MERIHFFGQLPPSATWFGRPQSHLAPPEQAAGSALVHSHLQVTYVQLTFGGIAYAAVPVTASVGSSLKRRRELMFTHGAKGCAGTLTVESRTLLCKERGPVLGLVLKS